MILAKKLLADLLKLKDTKEIDSALEIVSDYRGIRIPKRNGDYRILQEPPEPLKKLQRRILKYFLYRIQLPSFSRIFGFRQGLSYVDNARVHTLHERVRTVFRIDFKDAFPSITTDCLKDCLKNIFLEEIEQYPKGRCEVSLFPVKRVKWFREFLKLEKEKTTNQRVSPEILNDFADLLAKLTTFEGKLPQGAPTSGYLLNIVLAQTKLEEKICSIMKEWLGSSLEAVIGNWNLTIYADDITVSTSKESIPWEIRKKLIEAVESSGIFKVNPKKISYQKTKSIAPMITGLRITERGGFRKVVLPKRKIRMIRGLIRRSSLNPNDLGLKAKVKGYLAMLKPIYGETLPKQILAPLENFSLKTR